MAELYVDDCLDSATRPTDTDSAVFKNDSCGFPGEPYYSRPVHFLTLSRLFHLNLITAKIV